MTPREHIIALVQQLQEAKQEVTVAEVQLAEKQQIVSKIEALIDAAVNVSVSISNSTQPSEPATAVVEQPTPAEDLSIPERVRALVEKQPGRVFRLWDIVDAVMNESDARKHLGPEQQESREKSIRAAVARMAQTVNSGVTSPKRGYYQYAPPQSGAKILYPQKFQKTE